MNQYITRVALTCVLIVLLAGCVPVLVAGIFYSTNKSKQLCSELVKDPDFVEKMKISEYREYHRKVCKPKNKADYESAKDPSKQP